MMDSEMSGRAPGGPLLVAGWLLEELLGRGAYGDVWKARRPGTHLPRAVKFVRLVSAHDRHSWEQEVHWLDGLDDPSIIRLHDTGVVTTRGQYTGFAYIAMELGSGSLADLLEERGVLTERETVPVANALLTALHRARQDSVVHRDVKPGNLVHIDGRWKLSDWGMARLLPLGESRPLTSHFGGTPEYMAPWAFQGRQDHAADLYSAGVTLHRTLAGRVLHKRPAGMSTEAYGQWLRTQPAEVDGRLSEPWRNLIEALLAGDQAGISAAHDSVLKRHGQAPLGTSRNASVHQGRPRPLAEITTEKVNATEVMPPVADQPALHPPPVRQVPVWASQVLHWLGPVAVGIGLAILLYLLAQVTK